VTNYYYTVPDVDSKGFVGGGGGGGGGGQLPAEGVNVNGE
jgi:hypothetical protein